MNKSKQARVGSYRAASKGGRLRFGRLVVGGKIKSKIAAKQARLDSQELQPDMDDYELDAD